ncbi:3',5'-cyclic-nucleotide phosphodiesterase [bacterium]|nr:3',5'-cyclic-nucleotide phosphodiesterase [bacterium]
MLVNESIAIDAGAIGLFSSPKEQEKIRHVLLTHSHIDHLATLPIFIENVFTGKPDPVIIYGSTPVLDCLQSDVFNNRIWPDFIELSKFPVSRFLDIKPFEPNQTITLEGINITSININHVVPTVGYIFDDGKSAIGYVSDTAETEEIWERLNKQANLKAVFLEVTFPNHLQWLADVSKHLTPKTFKLELQKLKKDVPIFAVHLKGRYRDQVAKEVVDLNLPNVHITKFLKNYTF